MARESQPWQMKYCDAGSSSALQGPIIYDPGAATLTITFNGGRRYAYLGVSPQRYRALCNAESKGQYVNAVIKPNYAFKRV